MKLSTFIRTSLLGAAFLLWSPGPTPTQAAAAPGATTPGAYEFAIVKWDGPDRLYFNLPDKFELVYLSKIGITIPREAQAEEFCLAVAANKMAKDGWETFGFDSRRILCRRLVRN